MLVDYGRSNNEPRPIVNVKDHGSRPDPPGVSG